MTEYNNDPTQVDPPAEESLSGADLAQEPVAQEGPGFARWMLETVLMIAVAFLLAQGIKTWVVQPFVIPTGSMETTILIGDRVLAEKISYRYSEPGYGDIVVFNDPTERHPQLIKRVVAVAGEEIDIRDGHVFINGEQLDEPYLHGVITDPGTEPMPFVVPDGYVWVMGDNRPNSGDSRYIGPQPLTSIQGRAFVTYWPIDRIGSL